MQKNRCKKSDLQHLGLGQSDRHGEIALLHRHQQSRRSCYLKKSTQCNPAQIGPRKLWQALAPITKGIQRQQIDGGKRQAVQKTHQRGRQCANLRRQRALRRVAHGLRSRRKQHHKHPEIFRSNTRHAQPSFLNSRSIAAPPSRRARNSCGAAASATLTRTAKQSPVIHDERCIDRNNLRSTPLNMNSVKLELGARHTRWRWQVNVHAQVGPPARQSCSAF